MLPTLSALFDVSIESLLGARQPNTKPRSPCSTPGSSRPDGSPGPNGISDGNARHRYQAPESVVEMSRRVLIIGLGEAAVLPGQSWSGDLPLVVKAVNLFSVSTQGVQQDGHPLVAA